MITTEEHIEHERHGEAERSSNSNNVTSGVIRWVLGIMASSFLALVGLMGWAYSNLNLQLTEARGIVRQHEQQIAESTALIGTMADDIKEMKLDLKEVKGDVKVIVKETYLRTDRTGP